MHTRTTTYANFKKLLHIRGTPTTYTLKDNPSPSTITRINLNSLYRHPDLMLTVDWALRNVIVSAYSHYIDTWAMNGACMGHRAVLMRSMLKFCTCILATTGIENDTMPRSTGERGLPIQRRRQPLTSMPSSPMKKRI